MEVLFTKDKHWLDKWDKFVSTNNNGSHLILSDWLKSYQSYGFDFEIGIFLENEEIIGGFGAVIPKVLFFKFYIVPSKPLVLDGHNLTLEQLIEVISIRSKKLKTCYLQVAFPSFNEMENETEENQFLGNSNFKKGNRFRIFTNNLTAFPHPNIPNLYKTNLGNTVFNHIFDNGVNSNKFIKDVCIR